MQDGVLKLFAKASTELGRVLLQGVCVSPVLSILAWENQAHLDSSERDNGHGRTCQITQVLGGAVPCRCL